MLRNEVRYTTSSQRGVPGALNLDTGVAGPPSLFGAGEYAKDGLITVTEYLGRTRVVLPHGGHGRRRDDGRAGRRRASARCRPPTPSSTATTCRCCPAWR